MTTSPTKGGWLKRIRGLWASGHFPQQPPFRNPGGPVNNCPPFFVTSPDLPNLERDVDQILADNTRLLREVQRLREEMSLVKHHESLLASRIEAFRKKWPAIHKDFFAKERSIK